MTDRTVVVLPMPLRPISVTISPAAMSNDTPNSTWLRPYAVSTLESCSSGSAIERHRLLLAQIGAAHVGICANCRRLSRRNHAAVDQHGDAVGEREHRVHVVLDQQD